MNLVDNKYSISEIEEYIANNNLTVIDWYIISTYQILTDDFIKKYANKLGILALCSNTNITITFELLESILYNFNLYYISENIRNDVNSNFTKNEVIKDTLIKNNEVFKLFIEKYKSKYEIDKLSCEMDN